MISKYNIQENNLAHNYKIPKMFAREQQTSKPAKKQLSLEGF